VARAAGASVSTVSAAINNTDYISEAMRERIERAIRRLRYHPNQMARSLRLQRTHTIAIVVPDLSNSFYTELIRGVRDYAVTVNYTLLVGDSREKWDEERAYLEEFRRRRADGIVRIPAVDDSGAKAARVVGEIPIVYADRLPRAKGRAVGCVGVDSVAAAEHATRYLLSLGHRRIGIIAGPQENRNSADRLEGYRRALRSASISLDKSLIRTGDNAFSSGHRQTMEVLSRFDRPTAIFCTNNMMALGALQAIQELQLRCPKEISLLGFDDFEWATLLRPALTMIRQPAREIGATAARTLIEHIEGRLRGSGTHTLPTQLILRGSCSPPAPAVAKEQNRT
jgi:LacI family transcriptional regulator, repressor for deo operon, udp, cdd, tsx, nupC, and nupG